MNKFSIKNKKKLGFALLTAILTTGMLLLISFVIINVALKQLVIAYASQESQSSFYAAESGSECATFWDIKNPNDITKSAFATSTIGNSITCNTQLITSGNQTIPSTVIPSLIGGGGSANPTSIFYVNFGNTCAIVRVTKLSNGDTTINSRGYNTCNIAASRRFERGVSVTY